MRTPASAFVRLGLEAPRQGNPALGGTGAAIAAGLPEGRPADDAAAIHLPDPLKLTPPHGIGSSGAVETRIVEIPDCRPSIHPVISHGLTVTQVQKDACRALGRVDLDDDPDLSASQPALGAFSAELDAVVPDLLANLERWRGWSSCHLGSSLLRLPTVSVTHVSSPLRTLPVLGLGA